MLDYSTESGLFTRLKASGGSKIGDIAGSKHRKGYIYIRVNGKKYSAHHLAWLYVYGTFPTLDLDHINHIRDDNRIDNLREVSRAVNMQNSSMRSDNTTGVFGVGWRKDTCNWKAEITVKGTRIYLGSFEKYSEAVDARKLAEVAYGFHSNHGLKEVA